jgi:predicted helicase
MIETYKQGLNEQKINLDDDYIKFIRFAQEKIVKYGKGIIGIITNNSYLDGITHRRMRETLYNDFDKIYILNLHGNSNLSEPDKNVFDIKVGVSIILLIKFAKPLKSKEIYYFSTLSNEINNREKKHKLLLNYNIETIHWQKLNPTKPYYWFVEKDIDINNTYNEYFSLSKIFAVYGSGIKTERDSITIHLDKIELNNVLDDFNNLTELKIKEKYRLNDSRDWKISAAQKDVQQNYKSKENYLTQVHYRPFDFRNIFYTCKSRGFVGTPQSKIATQFMNKENIGLAFKRQNKKNPFSYCFVTSIMAESCLFESAYANNVVAPLYIYPKNEKGFLETDRKPNFTKEFTDYIKSMYSNPNIEEKKSNLEFRIDGLQKGLISLAETIKGYESTGNAVTIISSLRQSYQETVALIELRKNELRNLKSDNNEIPSPEKLLGYIYAILHSPTYRAKYYEYLKIDFPRIPFTTDFELFERISAIGEKLIECHLMQKNDFPQKYNTLGIFTGNGDRIVKKVEYNDGKINISKDNSFDNVAVEIWNFEIGGHQVLEHWLKARKERELNLDDINRVTQIIKIIAYTIEQVTTIDNETKNWI